MMSCRLGHGHGARGVLVMLAGCIALAALPVSAQEGVTVPVAAGFPAARQSARADFVLEGVVAQGGVLIGTAPSDTRRLALDGKDVPLSADERFLIAFDRDAAPTARLVAFLADGRTEEKLLAVTSHQWDVEYVDAARRPARTSDAFLKLRAPELQRIAAARAVHAQADGWRQRFIWPRSGRITGRFGAQRIYRGEAGAYHGGVDIAGAAGDPVHAPADGVVVLAADHPFTLEGNLLMIDHGMGLGSAFLHLSHIDVKTGDHVRRGQLIGAVGATGRATGPHLHWGMTWNDARIDPALLAGPMPNTRVQ